MATVEIDRVLAATPQRVHRALTDPDQLVAWFWPPSFAATATIEPKVGGAWRFASGPAEIGASGEFREFGPDLLAWTWRWDGEEHASLAIVTLVPEGEGTRLRVKHDELVPGDAQAHADGWESCLERLPVYLAQNP